ncbi:uncharacterized protein [Gossypium hirsutum]|uniref:Uncharacterized protein n=1 Tax=Gossypium hirsutum TaxID=3635 RepID=A0ABM3BA90_GOSHI|nr:uncharacterized protein LOC107944728 [Gossypium hirsutum]
MNKRVTRDQNGMRLKNKRLIGKYPPILKRTVLRGPKWNKRERSGEKTEKKKSFHFHFSTKTERESLRFSQHSQPSESGEDPATGAPPAATVRGGGTPKVRRFSVISKVVSEGVRRMVAGDRRAVVTVGMRGGWRLKS